MNGCDPAALVRNYGDTYAEARACRENRFAAIKVIPSYRIAL